MKRRIIVLLFLLSALLLASCGVNDESASDAGKKEIKNVELPDMVPADFPFPDSMGITRVATTEMSGGAKVHIIAFTHSEDGDELYKLMKAYLEGKGCEGKEISGQYICEKYEGDENLESTKINISDTVSTVQFLEMPGE